MGYACERPRMREAGSHGAVQGMDGASGARRNADGGFGMSAAWPTRLSGEQWPGESGTVRGRSHAPEQNGQRGAITAEFAMVLPVAAVLMAMLLSLTHVVTTSMACQDAASSAVREVVVARVPAHGEQARNIASTAVAAVAGKDATATISEDGGLVTVHTQCPVVSGMSSVLPASVQGSASGASS